MKIPEPWDAPFVDIYNSIPFRRLDSGRQANIMSYTQAMVGNPREYIIGNEMLRRKSWIFARGFFRKHRDS